MNEKILFAGGCHVYGYPFDLDRSFSAVAVRELESQGHALDLRTMGPFKLAHVGQLEAEIRRLSPRWLVLQLGNYETSKALDDWFSQMLTGKKRHRAASLTAGTSPFKDRGAIWKWRVRAVLKYLIDSILFTPLLDRAGAGEELVTMLARASGLMTGSVLLVGPLPCADPTILRYRCKLTRDFARMAEAARVPYLDAVAAWEKDGRDFRVFHDSSHLNPAGHEWLSRQVLARLAEADCGWFPRTAPAEPGAESRGVPERAALRRSEQC